MQLELKDLTKKYGGMTALDHISVKFTPGIYGILGANGAGKSTMMNLLTDNISRTGGEILFDGVDILKLGKDFRRVLGYMPQQQGFYEHMTAQTFLYYMAELKAVPKKQAKTEIENLLSITNLANVRHKRVGGFSGGMKQRVLLAQALLGDPKVVILDEPTAGLDPKERIRIRNFISEISNDRIILLATHIVSDIESISDQILMMKNGILSVWILRKIFSTAFAEKLRSCRLTEIRRVCRSATRSAMYENATGKLMCGWSAMIFRTVENM